MCIYTLPWWGPHRLGNWLFWFTVEVGIDCHNKVNGALGTGQEEQWTLTQMRTYTGVLDIQRPKYQTPVCNSMKCDKLCMKLFPGEKWSHSQLLE